MRKIVVSASSLPAGRNMSAQLEYIERVGNFGADMYHLDVMDGIYTKYKSVDYAYLEQLKAKSAMLFDVHLMVVNPEKVVDKYIKAGANIISVHFEVFEDKEDLIKLLKYIKSKGVMAGLAVDLETSIKKTEPILRYADMVLIMTVKAGKGGQEFQPTALKKVKYVRTLNPDVLIEVDGGINDVTAPQCVRAGADILVSGNYIYNNDTYEAIQHLKGKNG
ncbi:MAG: ribulose-phosphate 3-epimerase [Clostridia bacterium]|nr:ribulose-phosphate 3-epimerase [Clostridia bacterium]